eukprot:scaffold19321_cov34-Prasinocladus_malaysianus.AAC.1
MVSKAQLDENTPSVSSNKKVFGKGELCSMASGVRVCVCTSASAIRETKGSLVPDLLYAEPRTPFMLRRCSPRLNPKSSSSSSVSASSPRSIRAKSVSRGGLASCSSSCWALAVLASRAGVTVFLGRFGGLGGNPEVANCPRFPCGVSNWHKGIEYRHSHNTK